ncbi:MAG: hypothetical protein M1831_000761 [Alyxoria varia]|nr:MAG: hypothetical protein M1831_000761 [Alyxoria varia]
MAPGTPSDDYSPRRTRSQRSASIEDSNSSSPLSRPRSRRAQPPYTRPHPPSSYPRRTNYDDYRHDSHRRRSSVSPASSRSSRRVSHPEQAKLRAQLEWEEPGVRNPPSHTRYDERRRSTRTGQWSEKNVGASRASVQERRGHQRVDSANYYRNPERVKVTSGQFLLPKEPDTPERKRRYRRSSGYDQEKHGYSKRKRRKPWWRRWWFIAIVIALILAAIIIGVAVGVTQQKKRAAEQSSSSSSEPSSPASPPLSTLKSSNSSLSDISRSSIPSSARNTYLDTFTWYDTTTLNLTYTSTKVGGLPVIGLNTSYNDNIRANRHVPPLNEPWPYGTKPIRGMNLGGWLSLEPFITPSLFNGTTTSSDDEGTPGNEYTLTKTLGPEKSAALLEQHYASFVRPQTFSAIRAAGFDHVRIGFSYWAVRTYPGDPYLPHTSWRYLLRGIEWARQQGLRVCLDLHAAPGGQNGWNHSGREDVIGWLNGTDGDLNAERTLEIHGQLAEFFAQERYRNIVTLYGILNEPHMQNIPARRVLNWTSTAIKQLRDSALPDETVLVVSNGFMSLPFWHDALPSVKNPAESRILLDAHQYVIFNAQQLALDHSAKLNFACKGWSQQARASLDESKGFGTFMCGEWSQADTDCAGWVNGVDKGSRWEGDLDTGNDTTSVLEASCPTADGGEGGGGQGDGGSEGKNHKCSCTPATASPSSYSPGYKKWLRLFAEAQMSSFEIGWGFFYWTWEAEDEGGGGELEDNPKRGIEEGAWTGKAKLRGGGTQWSWRRGLEAGILPPDVSEGARERGELWDCKGDWLGVEDPLGVEWGGRIGGEWF